jgi:Methyltransferase small domain
VAPIDGLYVVTDNSATIAAGRARDRSMPGAAESNPLVMPGYIETYAFAQRTHRHPVERSLDLCTGSGVHALLGSRYAEACVGADISARAIAFASWNRRLNGIDRVQFRHSDVFEALDGTRFDRITANPPYQPDSNQAAGTNWWGAGPRGDAVIHRIVAGLPAHLTVDGELQMIGRFLSWSDGSFVEHVRRVLGARAGDFTIDLDTDEEPLPQLHEMYPHEPLAGVTRSEYGVATITRLR